MSAFRRVGFATAATALVLGTSFAVPQAAYADQNSTCTTDAVGKVSDPNQPPWEIANAGISQLVNTHGTQMTGTGVTVAVIDTGIQQQNQLSVSSSHGEVLNGEGSDFRTDDDGHGTIVASIIAAQKANGNAMQGIAPGVTLLSFREAGCKAPQNSATANTEAGMAKAINDAVSAGADVINISQDGYEDETALSAAVQAAYDKGVVIVASAGNQGDRDTTGGANNTDYGVDPKTYPASYTPYVLAVGAVDQFGTVPTFSETGTAKNGYYVGVVAPGVGVEGLMPNGSMAVDDGTSFSAPYVAAEAALIIQEHHWTGVSSSSRAYDVMKIIEATADGGGGYSASLGWGEVNIQKALGATSSDQLYPPGSQIPGLTPLLGVGPDKDGDAVAAASSGSHTVVKPYVAAAADEEAQHQQRWAYIALGAALLVAFVALAGSAVARDAARRRGARP
jgi:subtilisin family serine protease